VFAVSIFLVCVCFCTPYCVFIIRLCTCFLYAACTFVTVHFNKYYRYLIMLLNLPVGCGASFDVAGITVVDLACETPRDELVRDHVCGI